MMKDETINTSRRGFFGTLAAVATGTAAGAALPSTFVTSELESTHVVPQGMTTIVIQLDGKVLARQIVPHLAGEIKRFGLV